MRTLIVSDLHLGAASKVDLLRNPELRGPLFQALKDADRLILLGDVLELRHGPRREALAAARPFFEELGKAFAHGEVVILAGNHDHALIEPWLGRRAEFHEAELLALEQRMSPAEASPTLQRIESFCNPCKLTVAYPGLWVRPDVYVTHGHYLDCHLTVPTLERLGFAAMTRVLRQPESSLESAEDYEAVMGPVLAWIDSVAQRAPTGDALNGQGTVRAWRALRGDREKATLGSRIRTRALAGAFPIAVAALNRAGIGRFRADISSSELRRAGLRAMSEASARLGLGQAHVVFGHTHRAGPLPGDDLTEWSKPGAVSLTNCGCWSYDSYFLTDTPGESPYWPGGCVIVDEDGPPRLERMLNEHTHAQLKPAAG